MSKRITKLLIIDMLNCIQKILEYTKDKTFDEFLIDGMMTDAVIRNVQVMGEAAFQIPKDFKAKHPEIEWSKIIRSRHFITHEYDSIDPAIIWKIVKVHIPPLKKSLKQILPTA